MDWYHKIISWVFAAAITFTAVILPSGAMGSCMDCHNDTWQEAQKNRYIHEPVAKKQCTSCHTGDIDSDQHQSITQEQSITTIIADFNQQQKHINWMAETFTPAAQHFALLDQQHAHSTITVEAWSADQNKVLFDIKIPPLATMKTVQPFQPLKIEHIHVIDNHDMLLSHATVAWETSNQCRCCITYITANNEYSLAEDDLFTSQHNIVLHNCSKNILVQVSCEDPFGQQLSTVPQKLESLPRRSTARNTDRKQSLTEEQINFNFKKLQQDIWLELSAPLKFSVSIGTTENPEPLACNQQQSAVEIIATLPEPPGTTISANQQLSAKDEHAQLLPARAINLTICYRCHQNMLGWTSHPVDVIAPPGMIIPAEYPLLLGGRMSCMTCHSVHSSNKKYRLVKDSKRELCIGCHVNY